MRRRGIGLRARLILGATLLAVLAILAAALTAYGFSRTRALAVEALAAQHRIEAYGALSIRVNDWLLAWLTEGRRPDDTAVLAALDRLDRLVAEDVGAAGDETLAAQRARQSITPARLRAQFLQLDEALGALPEGLPGAEAAVAFYSAQAPGVMGAQIDQETRRRDLALSTMEAMRGPLLGGAVAVGLAAALSLLALYLWLFRPLFARLGHAAAAAEALVHGDLPPDATGHDELGLLVARLRQMSARIDRRRARLAQDYSRLETLVAGRTAELSAANARLAQVDSTRRRFFADVGHELRTPLTVILGEAELGEGSPDPAARASFATIRARAQRLFRRIEDILRIARSESGRLELASDRVDLAQVARAALADLAPVLKRAGVTATVTLPSLQVRGDADWLRQVFAGLFENAAKYAGQGAEIRVIGHASGALADVEITDTGPGLPAGPPDEVFARFVRGSGRAETGSGGFGVGLALARWVAETSGGRLDRLPGPGCRLRLQLPLWEEETWPVS
ncbi:MAG: HAMP domain-containing sensor histidine kinase [Paracoccaceae bacterium]